MYIKNTQNTLLKFSYQNENTMTNMNTIPRYTFLTMKNMNTLLSLSLDIYIYIYSGCIE